MDKTTPSTQTTTQPSNSSNTILSEPQDTGSAPTESETIEPEPSDPEPTKPEPTEPKPTDPEPTEPEPTEPESTEPEPTDPEPTEPEPTEPTETRHHYILNTSTMKFHIEGCWSADRISEENIDYFYGTREELIAMGYSPCGHCDP